MSLRCDFSDLPARDHGDAPAYANLLATLDQLAPDSAATIRAEVEGDT